jgi:hypothetical protein
MFKIFENWGSCDLAGLEIIHQIQPWNITSPAPSELQVLVLTPTTILPVIYRSAHRRLA